MVLEVAILDVKQGLSAEFVEAFKSAEPIISSMKGYIDHSLKKCAENDHRYLLLVNWETLEDHEVGFRESAAYQQWKAILHRFYDPFPTVQHYEEIA